MEPASYYVHEDNSRLVIRTIAYVGKRRLEITHNGDHSTLDNVIPVLSDRNDQMCDVTKHASISLERCLSESDVSVIPNPHLGGIPSVITLVLP